LWIGVTFTSLRHRNFSVSCPANSDFFICNWRTELKYNYERQRSIVLRYLNKHFHYSLLTFSSKSSWLFFFFFFSFFSLEWLYFLSPCLDTSHLLDLTVAGGGRRWQNGCCVCASFFLTRWWRCRDTLPRKHIKSHADRIVGVRETCKRNVTDEYRRPSFITVDSGAYVRWKEIMNVYC